MISKEIVQQIVTKNNLSGKWYEGWGALPYEFLVGGEPPKFCPNCKGALSENEISDSNAEDWEIQTSCDPCGLVWFSDK